MRRYIVPVVAVALTLAACSSPAPPVATPTVAAPVGDTLQTLIDLPPEAPLLELVDSTTSEGVTTSNITFPSDGLTISGVLHVPDAAATLPGVVLVHGFVDETFTTGAELQREQQSLAQAGYVVLVPDLRGHADSDDDPDALGDLEMGQTLDTVNALRALAGSGIPNLDPTRIALWGHSLGGLTALNAAVVAPDTLTALVLMAPSGTDLWGNIEQFLAPGDPVYEGIVAKHGTPETAPEHWADLTPTNFLDRLDAPVLVVQGTADDVIARESTEGTIGALQDAGRQVDVVWVDGGDHILDPNWEVGMTAIHDFLTANL